jgi:hypothetical protein
MAPVNNRLWDKQKTIRAVRSVQAGQMVYKWAAKHLSVPEGNLERCVKDNTKSLEELVEVNPERRPILPENIESELVKNRFEMDARYNGSRRNDVKHVAFQLAI